MRPLPFLLLLSCYGRDEEPSKQALQEEKSDEARGGEGWGGRPGGGAAPAAPPMSRSEAAPAVDAPMELGAAELSLDGRFGDLEDRKKDKGRDRGDDAEGEAAPTRSWFPESFLWMPLVETDASGRASVRFPIPDSLTTWRVLALAQSGSGAQSGGVATFTSTLPAYVDVVTPGALYAGDEVDLPVQVVNTTGEGMRESLDVGVTGAFGGGAGSLPVAGGGSATRLVHVRAGGPGSFTVSARYGSIDSIERTVPVRPSGQLVETMSAGAMAADREVTTTAIPGGEHGEVVLTAWPGALSVIHAEIEGGGEIEPFGRSAPSLSDAAYRYALATAANGLDAGEVAPETLRAMRIGAWQPIARAARVPDLATACLLAEALRGAPADSMEARLAERMAEAVADGQSPDGTWITGAANIDDTLAQAALCARAVSDNDAVSVRAEGVFERNVSRFETAVTAAWALSSGTITDAELATRLAATISSALETREDGTRYLPAKGARRPDGAPLSDAEATAVAALAFRSDVRVAGDLATALLGMRQGWGGWGDGAANLLVLRAIQSALPTVDVGTATVSFAVDGAPVVSGSVDGAERHKPIVLRSAVGAGGHTIRITSSVPGLAFTLANRAWTPWTQPNSEGALVEVQAPSGARVGQMAKVHVRIATPSTVPTDVIIGLPAGVRADSPGLDSLVAAGAFASWTGSEGSVILRGVAGGGWEGEVPVVPALAGTLSAAPSRLREAGGQSDIYVLPPSRWRIGG